MSCESSGTPLADRSQYETKYDNTLQACAIILFSVRRVGTFPRPGHRPTHSYLKSRPGSRGGTLCGPDSPVSASTRIAAGNCESFLAAGASLASVVRGFLAQEEVGKQAWAKVERLLP